MLNLSDDLTMLHDVARRFIPERYPVAHLRHLRDTHDRNGYDLPAWREICDMGWTGILVEEAFGGSDLGVSAAVVLSHEFGRSVAATPFLPTAVMAATALRVAGNEQQKLDHLAAIVAGQRYAFALDETAHHRPEVTETSLVRKKSGYLLNGTKRYVPYAANTDWLVVATKKDGESCLVLVKADALGVTHRRFASVDSHNAGDVSFANVEVDEHACLVTGSAGFDQVLDAGRIALAGELLGISAEVFDRTLQYTRERSQFGRPIGTFQSLQHRLSHVYCEIQMTSSLVMGAAAAIDAASERASLLSSMAKAKAGRLARLATAESIQMHGGIGMTDEFDLGFFMKRAQVAGQLLGDPHFHDGRIARMRGL